MNEIENIECVSTGNIPEKKDENLLRDIIEKKNKKKEYKRLWYLKNKERMYKEWKEKYNENKPYFTTYQKNYYENNKEKVKNRQKSYYYKNKQVILQKYKIHRQQNKEEAKIKDREKYHKYKNLILRRQKAYYYNNIDKIKNSVLKKYFGITLDQYNKMLTDQNNCCAICKTSQAKLKRKLSVDHDHSDGKIRGLLCTNCNRGLGNFKDNPMFTSQATRYLNNYTLCSQKM